MDEKVRSSIIRSVKKEGYSKKAGIRLLDLAPGYALVEMVPGAGDLNIFGMVHGGAIFSLADEAFQISCNTHGTVAVALSVNIVYHRPPKKGVALRAESKEISASRKTATYDIRIFDDERDPVATCQAVAYRKKEKLPFLRD
jgi:acyl-CoA thioesterase